jgi:voltage-gated potassium channel
MADEDSKRRLQEVNDEREIERGERFELLYHVSSLLEPAMVGLGLVFLVLLFMDFASVPLTVLGEDRLGDVLQWIWGIFLVDFLLRFVIAPEKIPFLKTNWLGALSLALPFLRPLRVFRVFRIARVIRGASLVRLIGGINRGIRVLRRITRGRQFAFVGGLTLVVVVAGAVGVRYFDRDYADSPVRTFGDALWWSSALVTTMNSELYVVSTESRVIALLQRLYALSVFGYITASIASYLIGSDASAQGESTKEAALQDEVRALRRELAALREVVVAKRDDAQNRRPAQDGS